jgi:hypothetical protein
LCLGPSRRCDVVDLTIGHRGQTGEDLTQVGEGIEPAAPTGLDHRVDDGIAAQTGQRSAILYTIVECCRRRGIDPLAYLQDVLMRLPSATTAQVPELTPEAWARAQRQSQPLAAAA